ncbi:MAG: nitrite/sulfite reductase, partial [Gammaproteobacteria bacterium]
MYRYDELDQAFVDQRVAEFRDQTRRHLAGQLSEDEFRPLRLRNGLYIQRHAPMLRIAIPYGLLASRQLAKLADIARRYDRGFGHFTTRQNLQLNWPNLADVPDILAELAGVQMHAIQTSGNCVRNVTADHMAGIARDEIDDPRPYCEIIRQWATLHPEFTYLPRKFKIAVTGSPEDRAASEVHDIGLHLARDARGDIGFTVLVGGGLGRAPAIGQVIRDFLPLPELLSYLEAILRVYNRHGRRDNLNKARIKVLVKSLGIARFREQVEEEWRLGRARAARLPASEVERVRSFFRPQPYETLEDFDASAGREPAFQAWYRYNTRPHRVSGYRAVFVSLKAHGQNPGDMSCEQMEAVAALAERVSFGLIRTTHNQNLLLADVRQSELYQVWLELAHHQLAMPNIGTLTDMIACPGLDFCSLANAGTLGVAKQIQERFDDLDYLYDLGDIEIK